MIQTQIFHAEVHGLPAAHPDRRDPTSSRAPPGRTRQRPRHHAGRRPGRAGDPSSSVLYDFLVAGHRSSSVTAADRQLISVDHGRSSEPGSAPRTSAAPRLSYPPPSADLAAGGRGTGCARRRPGPAVAPEGASPRATRPSSGRSTASGRSAGASPSPSSGGPSRAPPFGPRLRRRRLAVEPRAPRAPRRVVIPEARKGAARRLVLWGQKWLLQGSRSSSSRSTTGARPTRRARSSSWRSWRPRRSPRRSTSFTTRSSQAPGAPRGAPRLRRVRDGEHLPPDGLAGRRPLEPRRERRPGDRGLRLVRRGAGQGTRSARR